MRSLFRAPIAGLDKLIDLIAIMSGKSPKKEMAVLGPYYVAENKAGAYLVLQRNPNYWKHDSSGRQLPYIDSVRLDIQQNRDLELLRLLRGEIHFVNSIDAEYFEKVMAEKPSMAHDAGQSLDSEHMWFNEVANSSLPDYKKAWFRSTNFRRAVSEAINREDLARVAFPWTCASGGWHDFARKSVLVQRQAASASIRSGIGIETAGAGWISSARWRASRQEAETWSSSRS